MSRKQNEKLEPAITQDVIDSIKEEVKASLEKELREEIKKELTQPEAVDVQSFEDEEGEDKFYVFNVSGCYYDSKKETIDFDKLLVKVPANTEEVSQMHMMRRYVKKALKDAIKPNGEPMYPQRVEKIRQVHVDDVKTVTGTYSFTGKGIKDLNTQELQDLATAKDLRLIPLPNSGMSKRDMLIRAYADYSEKYLKKDIGWREDNFNYAKLPDIKLNGSTRSENGGKISNEEMIEMAQQGARVAFGSKDNPKDNFTLGELKLIADSKNISYPSNVKFDDLYNSLFSA